jgi:hypothetical protein
LGTLSRDRIDHVEGPDDLIGRHTSDDHAEHLDVPAKSDPAMTEAISSLVV